MFVFNVSLYYVEKYPCDIGNYILFILVELLCHIIWTRQEGLSFEQPTFLG